MTIDQFKRTKWVSGMLAIYDGEKYPIVALDFGEALVALSGVTRGRSEPNWIRCENITLVKKTA